MNLNFWIDISDEDSKNISDVYIGSRELAIIFHNGWTAVNSNRFKNFVLLQGDPKTETFTYKGTQPLDNVFIDEYGVIVFQLELLGQSNFLRSLSYHLLINSGATSTTIKTLGAKNYCWLGSIFLGESEVRTKQYFPKRKSIEGKR